MKGGLPYNVILKNTRIGYAREIADSLATFAEFESDLIRMRTHEGIKIARATGKLTGKKPKLSDKPQRESSKMYVTGDYSVSDLAGLFSVSRPTTCRTLERTAAIAYH